MKQDQPLHFGQRLIAQHGGKDGPGRNRHGSGRERDQGRDAERNRKKHDESQGTEPDPFMPADLERRIGYRGYFNRQDSPPKLTFIPARTVKGSAGKPNASL